MSFYKKTVWLDETTLFKLLLFNKNSDTMNLTTLTAKLLLCKRMKHENIIPMTQLQQISFMIIYASS